MPVSEEELYAELIESIPREERSHLIAELDSEIITARAIELQEQLSKAEMVVNIDESRTLFLAACKSVRDRKISMAQLASIHILDSAIRTLYINPMVYFIHSYVNAESEIVYAINVLTLAHLRNIPTSVKQFNYEDIIVPKVGMQVSALPQRMQKPPVQRFFNLNVSEWLKFCEEMAKAPKSEQFYQVLIAPEEGCWSSIISLIQKVLKCMQVLDWLTAHKNGFHPEKIMVIPSFTMFQAALIAKAHTLKRKPVELVPTYGYLEADRYAALKASGKLALALYLPEENKELRYQSKKGRFRTTIDGFPAETAFGGAMHDIYHAMREMAMSENVAKARMRLAAIAKNHPKNKINPESRPVDDILIDGELIYSYPPEIDTMFEPDSRSSYAEPFGNIFYTATLKERLHEDLKHAFIEDMVVNAELWRKEFKIGQSDLLKKDQAIYKDIKNTRNETSGFTKILTSIGLWTVPSLALRQPSSSRLPEVSKVAESNIKHHGSSLSLEQLKQINSMIEQLKCEIKSSWPIHYNKTLKTHKIDALSTLISYAQSMSIADAVKLTKKNFPRATEGRWISRRTAELFHNLENSSPRVFVVKLPAF
ncbi:MAG: hypothetical protein QM652_07385 [Legionella sp.]|uniref:hypothetical protein n=1 Tax=Legionella sp. TaxID=459 RepID=UPI0039E6F7B5